MVENRWDAVEEVRAIKNNMNKITGYVAGKITVAAVLHRYESGDRTEELFKELEYICTDPWFSLFRVM